MGDYPVLSRVAPGDIRRSLPERGPEEPEPWDRILGDFRDVVVPGITHWNHPRFFGYFSITGSAPGILGEALSAALNVNGMLWRTSPSATELEQTVLRWLADWLGLPQSWFGIVTDTASVSSLCALAAARDAIPRLDVRRRGLAGCGDIAPPVLYTSDQSHSSIEKAAIVLGIGQDGVRKIPSDSRYRMDVDALRDAIRADRDSGLSPFAVVATAGTTSTTSVDPIEEIAALCSGEGLWLHVDAAYAGSAAVVPELASLMRGWELADSVVVNPHKWLFTPIDCSVLYTRRPEILRGAFSLVPEYLRSDLGSTQRAPVRRGEGAGVVDRDDSRDDAPVDLMDFGVQLGRRFRALKLWLVMRTFGRRGIEDRIRQHVRMAATLASRIDTAVDFERLAPTPFSTICFRYRPGAGADADDGVDLPPVDEDPWAPANEALMNAVNETGHALLSHTRLRGRLALRLAIGNLRTTEADITSTWEHIQAQARHLSTSI